MIYLILFLGLILRLISINQSLWLDEATSATVARMSIGDIFTKFLPGDFHPPFYYLILKFWTSIFGFSEVSLRLPSVIFGLLTIYTTYLIAKKVFDKQVGIISAVLVATSGLFVYYSQEARMYALAAFLVSLLIYMSLEKRWFLFSVALVLLAMTDYVSLLIIPVFWLVGSKDWKKLTIAHVPGFAVFLAWLPVFQKQLFTGLELSGSNWWNLLGTVSFKNIALIPVKFILGRISFDNDTLYSLVAVGVISLFGYLIFMARKESKLILFWLVLPISLGILLSFKIPTLSYFRFLFCLPPFYILTAVGIEKTHRYKKLFLSLVLIVTILSTVYYLLNPNFQREDWRSAAKMIGNNKIVFPASSQKEALTYYGKGNQITDIGNFDGIEKEIWLSRYVWEIFDSKDSARQKIENLGYNKVGEFNFNRVVFWKYIK